MLPAHESISAAPRVSVEVVASVGACSAVEADWVASRAQLQKCNAQSATTDALTRQSDPVRACLGSAVLPTRSGNATGVRRPQMSRGRQGSRHLHGSHAPKPPGCPLAALRSPSAMTCREWPAGEHQLARPQVQALPTVQRRRARQQLYHPRRMAGAWRSAQHCMLCSRCKHNISWRMRKRRCSRVKSIQSLRGMRAPSRPWLELLPL